MGERGDPFFECYKTRSVPYIRPSDDGGAPPRISNITRDSTTYHSHQHHNHQTSWFKAEYW